MLKIYYNENYSSKLYVGDEDIAHSFGAEYCGDSELLHLLMLHGGITPPMVSEAERKSAYYANMLEKIEEGIFHASFELDPLSVSDKILEWRDRLVSAGWDMNSGTSEKLKFIRAVEPVKLPKGEADCWREVMQASAERPLLPEGSEITVTQDEKTLQIKIKSLMSNLQKQGVTVKFARPNEYAGGDLGRFQRWLLSEQRESFVPENDGSLRVLSFENDDLALKYVATCKPKEWELYLCPQSKHFDNVLRFLGQPVSGSSIDGSLPQTVQLFSIGNGIFEKPLNLNRILAWLEAPVTPLKRSLGHSLAKALAESGGVKNEEWNQAVDKYLARLSDPSQKRAEQKSIKTFMPFLELSEIKDGHVRKEDVKVFNNALRNWGLGLLSMENFPFEEIVRDQLGKMIEYCDCLIAILDTLDVEEFEFIKLQNWCNSIVSAGSYVQYAPQAGCRNVINREGDIFSKVSSLAWLCIEDEGSDSYAFDFLTDKEVEELSEGGVMIDDKNRGPLIRSHAMAGTVMKTRSLTLVEAKYIKGAKLKRHPLMIQLEAALGNNIAKITQHPEISESSCVEKDMVNNTSESLFTEIDKGVKIPRRENNESYSSVDTLIQHPFDYVCRYLAKLKDTERPSAGNVEKTMGEVAHKMIEMAFAPDCPCNIAETAEYERIFNDAVDKTGLMLRQPEYRIELNELFEGMKEVLGKLESFIKENSLKVEGCEIELDPQKWTSDSMLGSRVDMLLSGEDCKVVLDFKWTGNVRKYSDLISKDIALQLAIYKWLAGEQFESATIKAAYVLLPSFRVLTSDYLRKAEIIPVESDPETPDAKTRAVNGYEFRLKQFASGEIERAEGKSLEESQYGEKEQEEGLFPLMEKKGIIHTGFNDFKKLR